MDQKLRDDIDHLKNQRIELEAALLERDARALENRFDLESRRDEIERLHRRLRETESAYNSAITIAEQQRVAETKTVTMNPRVVITTPAPLQDNYVNPAGGNKNRSKRELELVCMQYA